MAVVLKFNAEKDVEAFFRKKIEIATSSQFHTKKGTGWETDGIIEWTSKKGSEVKLLLEAKYNKNFTNENVLSTTIAQVLYYCQKIKKEGDKLPNVILLVNEEKYSLFSFNLIKEYLNMDVDWSRAPSNPDPNLKIKLITPLENVKNLDVFLIKSISESFAEDFSFKTKPSKENLSAMYGYWLENIFPKNKYTSLQMIDLFYGCICYSNTDENHVYKHPSKKNTLVFEGKEYKVNIKEIEKFFINRERGLSAQEIDSLISIRDRIIIDDCRRRQGAFYTPTLWVNEAHSEMDKVLGETWRGDYIVWSCCAGTGNLTRDYDFKNLILSTAEESDVKAMQREKYNRGAYVFQYDFLNPETESPFFREGGDNVLPLSVKKLLKEGAKQNKRLVFLINPPYATAGNAGQTGTSKKGVAKTIANEEMKKAKLGACSQQLYAQFLFQCEQVASEFGFKNKSVGVFCKPDFVTTSSFAKFRPFWYERYSYQSGFMFQASHFADVSGTWGVSFTLWSEGKTDIKQDLPITLKDVIDESIISLEVKDLYSATRIEASKWARESVKELKTYDAPQMKSGLALKTAGVLRGKEAKSSLMYFTNNANNIGQNQIVYFTSHCSPNGHGGNSVLAGEGWRRAIALYSARKLVKGNWTNDKDEYLVPRTEIDGYEQWVDDCHVYALLHSSNNMTSMRGVEYKGKIYNIHNHFFWLTRKQSIKLYGSNKFARTLFRDAKNNPIPYKSVDKASKNEILDWQKNGDPYFSYILPYLNLSPLAKEILIDLQKLFIESLETRSTTRHVHEKGKLINLHLEAWDAGVYQHKKLWYTNEHLNNKWNDLRKKHHKLAELLKKGVYNYGFLKS